VARGYPCLSYQWQSNGVPIAGATDRTLCVTGVTLSPSCTDYSVVVQNALGSTNATARLCVTPKPMLRITEVMPASATNECAGHEDWFELTNYDTNAVNLQGYRFFDVPSLDAPFTNTQPVIIQPGASVIFVERLTPEAFIRWWGADNLPPGLQIITYTGFGLSESGDTLNVWNAAATDPLDVVDSVSFPAALRGISVYWLLGDWFPRDSQVGVDGAFPAMECDDVGSPGYSADAPLRLYSISRNESGVLLKWHATMGQTYQVCWKAKLDDPDWMPLGNYLATSTVMTAWDATVGSARQRFYRVEQLP